VTPAAPRADLDGTLAALADPTRRGVVELLRRSPRRAGELADAFDVSPPAMSRHLRVLRTRGLVEEARGEDDARVRVYRLRREPFDDLRRWIEQVEAFWGDQLDAFREHVARDRDRDRDGDRAGGRDRAGGGPRGRGRR
jgi:DNA-binding transcriptional ArsR family regulator